MGADVVWVGAADQVEGGSSRPPLHPWVIRSVAAAAAVAIVAALSVPWLDRRQRGSELAALTRCVTDGQGAVSYADASLRGMEQYISAGLGSSDSVQVRRTMFSLLSQAASAGLPGLDEALRSCDHVRVKSGHHEVAEAKLAYVRWLGAKDAFYQAIVTDAGVARATPPIHAELFDEARRALLASSRDPQRVRELQSALAA